MILFLRRNMEMVDRALATASYPDLKWDQDLETGPVYAPARQFDRCCRHQGSPGLPGVFRHKPAALWTHC